MKSNQYRGQTLRLYDIFCSSQSQIVFKWVQFEICSWKGSRFANYVMTCQLNFHCVTSRPNSVLLVHCAQKECAFSVLILRKGVFYSQCTQIHAHIHTLYYTHMQRNGAIRQWVCFGASFWNVSAAGQKEPGCQQLPIGQICQTALSLTAN